MSMKHFIRPQILALLGLFCGLFVGVAILMAKQWLVNQIVIALEDEVSASCDCSLAFDSFSLSFFTLSAKARNIRIIENGKARLSFKKITTDVDLSEIEARRIHLKNLTLSRGIADGVGPDSVTFKFIDQLTTPLPAEKQRPNRWRIILDSLFIKDSFLREPFGSSELSGSGVSMELNREDGAFILQPSIRDFRYTTYATDRLSSAEELHLGDLKATLQIQNSITTFNSISLGRANSSITARGTSEAQKNHLLTGSTKIQIEPSYIGLPSWLHGLLQGDGRLNGTLGSPVIHSTLSTDSTAPLTLALPNASPVPLQDVSGELLVDVNHGKPLVKVSNIVATSLSTELRSRSPLVFSQKGFEASFEARLPEFSYGPFNLRSMIAHIEAKNDNQEIRTEIKIKAEGTSLEGIALGPSTIEISLTSEQAKIKAKIANKSQGTLSWRGTVDLRSPEPYLANGHLSLENYHYLSSPKERIPSLMALTAKDISLEGPLNIESLRGHGDLSLNFPNTKSPINLIGKTQLDKGHLIAELANSTSGARSSLKLEFSPLKPSSLRVVLPTSPLHQALGNDDTCGTLGGTLDYFFMLANPQRGNGTLSLENLSVGCAPHSLAIAKPANLSIAEGAIAFDNISLTGRQSSLQIGGTLGLERGFNLSLVGDLDLESISNVIPNIDNLQGNVRIKATATGSPTSPSLLGTADLSQARFGFSSPDIEAHEVEGKFTFENDEILVDGMHGSINGGLFNLQGTVRPFDWKDSALKVSLEEVSIEPEDDTSITFSGELTLGASTLKKQTLSGDIEIIFAEVAKEFDINKIVLKTLSGYFLPARMRPSGASSSLDMGLNINITAPRNLFIITPFLSAELNADLRAAGTTSSPTLTGTMQFLTGWIGLKGNRFDINSGKLNFTPSSLTPEISLVSEGTLRATTGESITVILEASGQLPAPKITLSSDRGLSQNDLLYLITSSRPIGESSLRARMNSQYESTRGYIATGGMLAQFRSFFRSLTRLDVLSFEPAYNQFSGAIEPAIIARKNISPRFNLVGESLFSSVSNSKAGGVFALTPSIDINAFIQTVSTQKNSILSSDVTFTVLSKQAQFVTLNVAGNRALHRSDLLSAARLNTNSRIENSPSTLLLIEKQLVSYMQDRGYRRGSSNVRCIRGQAFCEELLISVEEHSPSTILGIAFDGDPLPKNLINSIKRSAPIAAPATKNILEEIEQKTIVALRNEGYISARVTAIYIDDPAKDTCILRISTDLQQPISFVFKGNTVFSPEDFLSSINLFTRKRAFGTNTINHLVQNIEQMYLSRGHLFVQVQHTAERDDSGRITYLITIQEDMPISVQTLKLRGNSSLSKKQIQHMMEKLGFEEYIRMLTPQYAIPDQLDSLKKILLDVYLNAGFPSAEIHYQILPSIAANNLEIVFDISEGPHIQVNHIKILGVPHDTPTLAHPDMPAALPTVNDYLQGLLSSLIDTGYLSPALISQMDPESRTLNVTVEPGVQTFISHISIEGLGEIKPQTIRDNVTLQEGAPLRQKNIEDTKRALLRTGLFSRIDILPTDGSFDDRQEGVTIRLLEKPLETLEVGLGANSEFGLHTFGEASDKSLFADGRTLTLRVDTYFDQSRINPSGSGLISQGFTSLRFVDPTLIDSQYTLTEELRYQRQELSTQEFNLDRLLFGSYVLRRFDPSFTLSAGHSFLFDNPQDVSPDAIISDLDDKAIRLSFVSGVLKLDERDDPLIPSRGYTFTLEPKIASSLLGSEASFLSLLARSSAIIPISHRYSLGASLNGGIAQALGSTDEIPITQRFYLGGRTSVRGFRENSLGPRGANGSVLGGNALLSSKLELQHRTLDSLSTHIFFDVGNVFLRGYDENEYGLRKSIGAGFQYLSPIGPIGFDIGHPLDEKPGEPSVRLHFSVGSMF